MSSARKPLWWIIAAAVLAGIAGFLTQRYCCAPAPIAASSTAERPALRATLAYPAPKVVPEFALEQADGSALGLADLRGHWTLVFFGFTRCPDACPTTLAMFKQLTEHWAKHPQAARAQLWFISVDPERDRGQIMADYAKFFSPDIRTATGETAALDALTRALGIVYMQRPLDGGDYTIDHSTQVLLIDPSAHLAGIIRPPFDAAAIAADLDALAP
jgi:protein SCO1/2